MQFYCITLKLIKISIFTFKNYAQVSNDNVIPKLVYELDEFNNLDNLSPEDQSRLNMLTASNSILNYQVITENSQEDEPDTSLQAVELSNLDNLNLRTSFSSDDENPSYENLNIDSSKFDTNLSIDFDTKFQPNFQNRSRSISPILRNWSRSKSECEKQQYFDFFSPHSQRHPCDRYFDNSSIANARRKKFANYKQYSCLNLGDENRYADYPIVDFINDESLNVNRNNLFVNADFPSRRLSAPSGHQEAIDNQKLILQQLVSSQQQLKNQLSQQQLLSQQSLNHKTTPKLYSNKYQRWNTVDDAFNVDLNKLPKITITDEQINLPNIESSEQIYGAPDPVFLNNLTSKKSSRSSSRQSSPKSPKSASHLKQYATDNLFRFDGAQLQKSYSAGNNDCYDDLVLINKQQQLVSSKQSSIVYQSARSKSPRRLRAEINRNPSWSANMSTLPPISIKKIDYTSSSTSSSDENEKTQTEERELIKLNTRRRFSPHLILSNAQSLPTPPATAPANYDTFFGTYNNKKKPRSPTNLYHQTSSSYQPSSSTSSKKQPSRCYSADNRQTNRDIHSKDNYQTSKLSTNKYLTSNHPELYRTRSFNTTEEQFTPLKKQQKRSNSPTTATTSSSPSLSDLNSEIKWRNAIRNESSNFFNKNVRTLDKVTATTSIYKPSKIARARSPNNNDKVFKRSNSDEATITNRRAYYYLSSQVAARRKSRSFETPTDEEINLIQLENQLQSSKQKAKLKNQSSSDTVLVESIEQQLSLDQQLSFSTESIQKKGLDKDENADKKQFDLNYIEIANKAKSITKDEIKSLAKKLELKSPDKFF